MSETKQEKKTRVEELLVMEAIHRFSRQFNDKSLVGFQTTFQDIINEIRKEALGE